MARRRLPRDLDLPVLLATLVLVTAGVVFLYSAGQTAGSQTGGAGLALRQGFRVVLGLVAMAGAILVPLRILRTIAYPVYALGILLICLIPFLGARELRGDLFLRLGPLTFEPSEPAKLAVILALSRFLSGRRRPESLRRLVVPFLLVFVPAFMVARLPDLGTAVVLAGVFFPMLYWAGLHPLYLALLLTPLVGLLAASTLVTWAIFLACVLAIIYLGRLRVGEAVVVLVLNLALGLVAPLLWGHLEDYQQERILTFLNPERDPLGAGYQILQSKVALGSGGLWGKGFLHGTQKGLAFLPARHTDFIFSVVGEEAGFLGAGSVLVLYLVIIVRGFSLAGQVRNRFASLLAAGISTSLLIHVAVNVGMTMGLLPVTGLPIPLLTYGGSSLLTTLVSIGLLLNVGLRRREH